MHLKKLLENRKNKQYKDLSFVCLSYAHTNFICYNDWRSYVRAKNSADSSVKPVAMLLVLQLQVVAYFSE
jgi:hypothetical protein